MSVDREVAARIDALVAEWRTEHATSSSLGEDRLDELADHLRATSVELAAKGFAPEECFLVARHRLGDDVALEREFERADGRARVANSPLAAALLGAAVAFPLVDVVNSMTLLLTLRSVRDIGTVGPPRALIAVLPTLGASALAWILVVNLARRVALHELVARAPRRLCVVTLAATTLVMGLKVGLLPAALGVRAIGARAQFDLASTLLPSVAGAVAQLAVPALLVLVAARCARTSSDAEHAEA